MNTPFDAEATRQLVGSTKGAITILSASEKLPLAEAMSRLDAALPYQPEIATPTPEADRIAAWEPYGTFVSTHRYDGGEWSIRTLPTPMFATEAEALVAALESAP